jgi:methionyl-tRNA formyltransferase
VSNIKVRNHKTLAHANLNALFSADYRLHNKDAKRTRFADELKDVTQSEYISPAERSFAQKISNNHKLLDETRTKKMLFNILYGRSSPPGIHSSKMDERLEKLAKLENFKTLLPE